MENIKRYKSEDLYVVDKENGGLLGEGVCASVFMALLRDTSRWRRAGDVAVKIGNNFNLSNEILVMAELNHQNVVCLIGMIDEEVDSPQLIMEYFKAGDLAVLFSQNYYGFSDDQMLVMTRDIAAGMKYLHFNQNIVHADLHSMNCFVGAKGQIKIGDFGFSFFGDDEQDFKDPIMYSGRPNVSADIFTGARFKAPEVISGPKYKSKFFKPGDVWSFGMLLYEMWTFPNRIPYINSSNNDVVDLVVAGTFPIEDHSDSVIAPGSIISLMKWCWSYRPIDRPTFEDIGNFLKDNFNIQLK